MAREVLIEGLKSLDIEPDIYKITLFETYLRELLRWNKTYNLTAITDERDIINKHFLDSLLYLKFIMALKGLKNDNLCDVGTGAGFPGVPFAIIREDIQVSLVESSRKKCSFLYQIRQLLGLKNIEIINKPVEELSNRTFDLVVTRALFNIQEMVKKCNRLLSPQGLMILSKGEKGYEELKKIPNGYSVNTLQISIPNTNMARLLISICRSKSAIELRT